MEPITPSSSPSLNRKMRSLREGGPAWTARRVSSIAATLIPLSPAPGPVLVDPAIERRDEVLDYPHAERSLAELSAQRGYARRANTSQDVSRAHTSTRFRSKRQHPDERNAMDSPHHGSYGDQGADGENNSDHADTS